MNDAKCLIYLFKQFAEVIALRRCPCLNKGALSGKIREMSEKKFIIGV